VIKGSRLKRIEQQLELLLLGLQASMLSQTQNASPIAVSPTATTRALERLLELESLKVIRIRNVMLSRRRAVRARLWESKPAN
jgi:hypothetical protein